MRSGMDSDVWWEDWQHSERVDSGRAAQTKWVPCGRDIWRSGELRTGKIWQDKKRKEIGPRDGACKRGVGGRKGGGRKRRKAGRKG